MCNSDTEMCEVTPKPDGFTKWDKTVVVGTTETSLNEFFALFKAKTDLNITMLFHPCANAEGKPWSGRLLYNNYDEDESADHRDRPLLAYMGELYEGEGSQCACQPDSRWVSVELL